MVLATTDRLGGESRSGRDGWVPATAWPLEPPSIATNCEQCLSGHHNLCAAPCTFSARPPDPGFHREYINLPAANLLPLPPEISFQEGTLFEPLAVVLHSLRFRTASAR